MRKNNRKWQKEYIKRCIPSECTFSVNIDNNIFVINIGKIRIVSSSIEETKEKLKVALNK